MVLACTSVMCTKPISWMASCVWGVSSREANSLLLMIPLTVAACLSTPSSEAPALACSRGAVVRVNVHVRYQTQAGNCSGDHDLAQCGGGPLCALNRCSGQCLQVAQPGHTCQNCMLCSLSRHAIQGQHLLLQIVPAVSKSDHDSEGHNLAVHLSEMPDMMLTGMVHGFSDCLLSCKGETSPCTGGLTFLVGWAGVPSSVRPLLVGFSISAGTSATSSSAIGSV